LCLSPVRHEVRSRILNSSSVGVCSDAFNLVLSTYNVADFSTRLFNDYCLSIDVFQVEILLRCLDYVRGLMANNFLQPDEEKTENFSVP